MEKYPEAFDGCLDCVSYAITCAFNRKGTLLAVGCNDGRIVIWDFTTRCIAKIIQAHTHPVFALSWSRNGYKIASASTDNLVCVWDVLNGDCVHRFRFPTLLSKVQYNPRNDSQLLICLIKHPAVLIDLTTKQHITIPLDDEALQDTNIVASFDRRGEHIYTGNSKGKVLIFKSKIVDVEAISKQTDGNMPNIMPTLQLVACFKMTSAGGSVTGTAIKAIEFAKRGENFLVCTADRVIRIYNADIALACSVPTYMQKIQANALSNEIKEGNKNNTHRNSQIVELEPIQKLCDLVNRTQWKSCCFSGGRCSLPNLINGIGSQNSESKNPFENVTSSTYVCAGSAKQHSIYIWELATSTLVKILHGTKGEILLDLAWHPSRGIIASVSGGGAGSVTLWSHPRVENWSAFAPDFRELDDNVEYVERESEFDLSDEDKAIQEALLELRDDDDFAPAAGYDHDEYIEENYDGVGVLNGQINGIPHDERRKKRKKRKKHKPTLSNGHDNGTFMNGDISGLPHENNIEDDDDDDDDSDVGLIDVTTVEQQPMFVSSDEEADGKIIEDSLLYLPMAPEIEDPEESINLNLSNEHNEDPSYLTVSQPSSVDHKASIEKMDVDGDSSNDVPQTGASLENTSMPSEPLGQGDVNMKAVPKHAVQQPKPIQVFQTSDRKPPIVEIRPMAQTLKQINNEYKIVATVTSLASQNPVSNKIDQIQPGGPVPSYKPIPLSSNTNNLNLSTKGFTFVTSQPQNNTVINNTSTLNPEVMELQSAKISLPIKLLTTASQNIQQTSHNLHSGNINRLKSNIASSSSAFQPLVTGTTSKTTQLTAQPPSSSLISSVENINLNAPVSSQSSYSSQTSVRPLPIPGEALKANLPPTLKFKTSNPVQILTPASLSSHQPHSSHQKPLGLHKQNLDKNTLVSTITTISTNATTTVTNTSKY